MSPYSALRKALVATALLLVTVSPTAIAATILEQRSIFLDAEKALKNGEYAEFRKLKALLNGYPLVPYIEYELQLGRLHLLTLEEAEYFLQKYQDSPLSNQFRLVYLNMLGRQKRWKEYLHFYKPTSNATRACLQLQALIETGQSKSAFDAVEPLWLNANSMPKECDPVFDAWRKAGQLSETLVWARIELAMEKKNISLAKYLGRLLPETERVWLDRWLWVDNQPAGIEQTEKFPTRHEMRGKILLYGLSRLARQNLERAESAWQLLQKNYNFSSDQQYQAERALALASIYQNHPQTLEKLRRFTVSAEDTKLHELRLREALAKKEWRLALEWINALPPELESKENWRYWKARALLETGDKNQANTLFAALAKNRSYHGFLSADRIGQEYNLNNTPISATSEQIQAMASRAGFQCASELYALGRLLDARREWNKATENLSSFELQTAAKLAQQWEWHSQAIFTLARSGYWEDLELRFPLEHSRHVETAASAKNLDKAWVLAVIRQESAFSVDAESHAGALGLMQLMPATAQGTAKSMNIPPPKREELLTPATNIDIGTSYLKKVYEQLYDNPVLAISAYNAGPHRVLRWLPEKAQEADVWVETIPFNETRRYTERVLEYSVIYDERLGNTVTQIKERMPMIPSDSFKVRSASL